MKTIYLILLSLFITFLSFSASHTSNGSGNWNTISWIGGIAPISGNNVDITISNTNDVVLNSNIAFNNNCRLYIYGNLTINGNFIINNNLIITVVGNLIINGNVNINNNSDVDIFGNINVSGDFNLNSNNNIQLDVGLIIGGNLNGGSGNVINGSGTLSANLVDTDIIISNDIIVLPIELISFNILYVDNSIVFIEWVVAKQVNCSHYILYRSKDLKDWKTIQISECKYSNYNDLTQYTAVDDLFYNSEIVYYKLQQYDLDGKFVEYNPIALKNKTNNIRIKDGIIYLRNIDIIEYINIYDMNGNIISRNIKESYDLENGLYIIIVNDENCDYNIRKTLIQK